MRPKEAARSADINVPWVIAAVNGRRAAPYGSREVLTCT